MNDPSAKVQSLSKGLKVLSVINDFPEASISQLVQETKLPKATVIRLVQSLCTEGYVQPLEGRKGYQVSNKVIALSRGVEQKSRYIQAADPILRSLGSSLKWPSELLLRDGDTMTIETDNRDTAPVQVQLFERRRFPLLESASGQAVLSTLPIIQIEQTIRRIDPDRSKAAYDRLMDDISQVAKRGYAVKSYDFLSPGLRAIAVPLIERQKAIGAVTLIHYQRYMPADLLHQEVLPEIQYAVRLIGEVLSNR